MNIVKITASGKVGCGKSAVLGEIEIALKAIGLKVEWDEGAAEKGLTHADWIPELEMYQPTVVLSEKIEPAAPAAQGDAKELTVDSLYSNGYVLTPDNVVDVPLPAAGWAGAYTLRQMHGYAEDFYAANKDTKITKPTLSSSTIH